MNLRRARCSNQDNDGSKPMEAEMIFCPALPCIQWLNVKLTDKADCEAYHSHNLGPIKPPAALRLAMHKIAVAHTLSSILQS